MNAISLVHNVPIPPVRRPPAQGTRRIQLQTMPIGGMYFLPGRTARSVSAYVSRIAKQGNLKYSVRTLTMRPDEEHGWVVCDADHEQAVEGAGVWRVQ